MQGASDQDSQVIISVPQCKMHRLSQGKKHSFNSGTCKIMKMFDQTQNKTMVYLNLNTFYYPITPQTKFIRVLFPKSNSYIFKTDHGLTSLSFPNVSANILIAQNVENFERILSDAEILYNYDSVQHEIKDEIDKNYPDIKKNQIYSVNNIQKTASGISKNIGGLFGSFSSFVEKKIKEVTKKQQKQKKVEEPKQPKQSKQQQYAFFKNLNNKAISLWKPLARKTTQYRKSLASDINHSENKHIKYVKELSKATTISINEGYSETKKKQTTDQYMQSMATSTSEEKQSKN